MELTSELSTISILLIGFMLGLQHAVEADHLAAVSTIVSEKKSLLTASLVGGFWGIGHTISLTAIGLIVIFTKLRITETAEARLEAAVGAMLVVLGANALRKLLTSERVHIHKHRHGEREHLHVHSHDIAPETSHHGPSIRSVLVGMMHGLAGSAALMLLVLPAIDSTAVALVYIVVFGLGSVGGMIAMSFFIGLPLYFTADRFKRLNAGIRLSAAVLSLGIGAAMIYEKLLAG